MKQVLSKIINNGFLSSLEAESYLSAVLNGEVTSEQLAGVLSCMAMRGESENEILGFIKAMHNNMISIKNERNTMDVCGTGGDGLGTFNISTAVALVVAGAGVKVAKHGNRAASSQCGSADVLESLGVNIELSPEHAQAVLESAGIVFLFAPLYHPAMKHIAPVRKALGVPTIFNTIGPFSNPAGVTRQLIGVPSPSIAKRLADVATRLNYSRLLIVSSHDGMDEISIAAKTTVFQIESNEITKFEIDPKEYKLYHPSIDDISGGSPIENAAIIRSVLDGDEGSARDIVILNAGFALYVANKVTAPKLGIIAATESIDEGKAKQTLEDLIIETNRYE